MGMTFDEALDHLYTYSSTLGSGQTTQAQHEEAKRVAIDVMRKYQKQERVLDKIREIVDEWQSDSWTDNLSYECMIKIAEILDKYKAESEDKEYILNKI